MSQIKPNVIVILGPTATGKSELAVHLAKKFGGEIISADSRQVYKGLDIGTGKVTKREMGGIRHYLLDVISPKRQFTAGQFKALAARAIQNILHHGKLPILVGGTGFYIDAVLGEVSFPEVPPDTGLRKSLAQKPLGELLETLESLDLERATTIDRANRPRIIRAIEIARVLGKVPQTGKKDEHYNALKIGLRLPDDVLKEKISARLSSRLRLGMLAEAKRLHEKGLSWKRMDELGLEYRYLSQLLQKKLTRKQFEEELARAIWQYSKRQMRWFKRDHDIKWFKPNEYSKIEKETRRFLNG